VSSVDFPSEDDGHLEVEEPFAKAEFIKKPHQGHAPTNHSARRAGWWVRALMKTMAATVR
jgi:hypothetical protein